MLIHISLPIPPHVILDSFVPPFTYINTYLNLIVITDSYVPESLLFPSLNIFNTENVVGRSSFMKQKVLSVTPGQATLRACVSDTCPTITTPTQHMHAGLCVRPRACGSGVRMRATLPVPRRSIACHRGWHAVLCRRVCTQGRGTNLVATKKVSREPLRDSSRRVAAACSSWDATHCDIREGDPKPRADKGGSARRQDSSVRQNVRPPPALRVAHGGGARRQQRRRPRHNIHPGDAAVGGPSPRRRCCYLIRSAI